MLKTSLIISLLGTLAMGLSNRGDCHSSRLSVTITEIPQVSGKIATLLCDASGNEIDQQWLFVKDDRLQFDIDSLCPGSYGLKFFHDANNNGTMDKNMLGIPTESFGFSREVNVIFGMPSIDDILFEVNGDTSITIKARTISKK